MHKFLGTMDAQITCSWSEIGWFDVQLYLKFLFHLFGDCDTNGWIVSTINLSTSLEILTM